MIYHFILRGTIGGEIITAHVAAANFGDAVQKLKLHDPRIEYDVRPENISDLEWEYSPEDADDLPHAPTCQRRLCSPMHECTCFKSTGKCECDCCNTEGEFAPDQDGACCKCRHERELHYGYHDSYECAECGSGDHPTSECPTKGSHESEND